MPHYRDGTAAEVGDLVKGKPYNTRREIVGEVFSIREGTESCNCEVAFVERVHPEDPSFRGEVLKHTRNAAGDNVFLTVKTEYGETKAFEKLL